MGETAVITPSPDVEENETEKMTEDRIVNNVPRTYQARSKKFIGHPKDYTGISWNATGEMVVDGIT